MGRISDNDEEQLQMLLMVLEDVRSGICMFQSEEQSSWVERIQKKQKGRKLTAHNIADDDEAAGMPAISDFRRWLGQSDAEIVVVYNLQLLGIRFGDDEAVERLNSMRDQIQNLGKLFLFGVTPYFGTLLSRNARDLYSCIRYHFHLSGLLTDRERQDIEYRPALGRDDALAEERYWEYKKRAKGQETGEKIRSYLACMESWLRIRGNLPFQEGADIRKMADDTDLYYRQTEVRISDAESIWILAGIWLELEEKEKAFQWYQLTADKIRNELGESHRLYADALVNLGVYYEKICDFAQCESNYKAAVEIYKKENAPLDGFYKMSLINLAVSHRRKDQYQEALAIYEELLQYDTQKYGSGYFENAIYLNNMGRVYVELSDFSRALARYQAALEIVENLNKRDDLLVTLYHNISSVYLKNEDTKNAWKYIRLAKREAERLYGSESLWLVRIYNMMSGIWRKRGQPEKELEYLEKALDGIRKTHSEGMEESAFVYHNMGSAFIRRGEPIQAINFYNVALKKRLKIYGRINKYTADTYEGLAAAFWQLSDMKSYNENQDQANEIYELLSEKNG